MPDDEPASLNVTASLRRLGNELLCPSCQLGDCDHCTARRPRSGYCECGFCPWLTATFPVQRKEP